jgi:hypothetical protein
MTRTLTTTSSPIHLRETEPLEWLVAAIFTQQFLNRETLLRPTPNIEPPTHRDTHAPALLIPAPFKSHMEIYAAAEDFIQNDEEATRCFEDAETAVENQEIRFCALKPNMWGEKPGDEPAFKVNTYDFLRWAEDNGYMLPQYIREPVKHLRTDAKNREYRFPKITRVQFEQASKQPLWTIKNGILHLLGRRHRDEDQISEHYDGNDRLYYKMQLQAHQAYKAGLLKVAEYQENMFSQSYVVPEHLIKWAKTLPFPLPILNTTVAISYTKQLEHCTPEMELMFGAIQHFWKTPDKPPLKKHVTAWLIDEAKQRKFELSDHMANAIDTLIRPQNARRGGIKAANS